MINSHLLYQLSYRGISLISILYHKILESQVIINKKKSLLSPEILIERRTMSSLISPYDFTEVTHQLRSFFDERGFQEVHTQNRLSILAACEDLSLIHI